VVAEQLVFKVRYTVALDVTALRPFHFLKTEHLTVVSSIPSLSETKGVTKVLGNFQEGDGMEHSPNKLSVIVTSFVDS
jgi:hypothetical protein